MKEMPSAEIKSVPDFRFAHIAPKTWDALAKLLRTGWVKRGVKNPESVQEHTISLRNIAASIETFSENDKEDLLDMLEVHDWPEAIHGDQVIVTDNEEEKMSLKAIKFKQEHQALIGICSNLGVEGTAILNLWLRFETADDEVAMFARQLDKYQAIEKAMEYEEAQAIPLFKEFLDYARKSISHPILLEKIKKLESDWELLKK
ncbi:MAG: HD domain-containing protein [Candidatus Moraniibacteriota bacterium]